MQRGPVNCMPMDNFCVAYFCHSHCRTNNCLLRQIKLNFVLNIQHTYSHMHIVANQQFETCVTIDVIIFYALNYFQMATFEILHFLSHSFAVCCITHCHWISWMILDFILKFKWIQCASVHCAFFIGSAMILNVKLPSQRLSHWIEC